MPVLWNTACMDDTPGLQGQIWFMDPWVEFMLHPPYYDTIKKVRQRRWKTNRASRNVHVNTNDLSVELGDQRIHRAILGEVVLFDRHSSRISLPFRPSLGSVSRSCKYLLATQPGQVSSLVRGKSRFPDV